jgi:hypothetical protein
MIPATASFGSSKRFFLANLRGLIMPVSNLMVLAPAERSRIHDRAVLLAHNTYGTKRNLIKLLIESRDTLFGR